MITALEALFQLNKKWIMTSKFQNNIYKGQKVCEYLGENSTTFKVGLSFEALLNKMINKLPLISYERLVKHRDIYEKYPHLYLRYIGRHNYLVNIGEFCKHLDDYAIKEEIPISFFLPSFFSRYYTIRWLNKKTKTIRDEKYASPTCKPPKLAKDIFLHLFYFNQSYEEILERINWADYESFIAEFKNMPVN